MVLASRQRRLGLSAPKRLVRARGRQSSPESVGMEFTADLSRQKRITPRLCPLNDQCWLLFLRSADLELSVYLPPAIVEQLVTRAGVFLSGGNV